MASGATIGNPVSTGLLPRRGYVAEAGVTWTLPRADRVVSNRCLAPRRFAPVVVQSRGDAERLDDLLLERLAPPPVQNLRRIAVVACQRRLVEGALHHQDPPEE